MKPCYFASPAELRKWFQDHFDSVEELWVGYYKKQSGKPSVTWPESVDEALCYGWIDGIRKSIDDERYTIRFTPRKPKSNWSQVNIRKVKSLIKEGRMETAGLDIFKARDTGNSKNYSYENTQGRLTPEYEKMFSKNKNAWKFFQAQVASYRKPCISWVMSAKQEETRLKRLATLIKDSAEGNFIAPMRWNKRFSKKKEI